LTLGAAYEILCVRSAREIRTTASDLFSGAVLTVERATTSAVKIQRSELKILVDTVGWR
jgi:hypothetical protein